MVQHHVWSYRIGNIMCGVTDSATSCVHLWKLLIITVIRPSFNQIKRLYIYFTKINCKKFKANYVHSIVDIYIIYLLSNSVITFYNQNASKVFTKFHKNHRLQNELRSIKINKNNETETTLDRPQG